MTGALDADLVVAGGGPVGIGAAIAARSHGLRVVVVEPRDLPVDKACGEGLMPGALELLRGLGVDPVGRSFVGIRYVRDGRSVDARFRRGPGRGVRRTVLHEALVARAIELGVSWQRGAVTTVEQDDRGVTAAGLRSRWLVAADGLHSVVRRDLGLQAPPAGGGRAGARYGLRRHFRCPPWTDHVEVHWSARSEAYVTPVADDLVGVAVLGPADGGFDRALDCFPALRSRLRAAEPVTPARGAGPLRQRVIAVRSGRVLLAGDAAGYVDALTGEGLAVGLATARAAVEALAADRPEEYPAAWARATRRYRVLTHGLLAVSARPAGRRALVPAAALWPAGFRRTVDLLA